MKKGTILILVLFLALGVSAESIKMNSRSFGVDVVSSSEQQVVIEYNFGSFERQAVEIDGQTMYRLGLEKESRTYTAGDPELPKITRSISIGDDALMEAQVISSDYTDYRMPVIPSRGSISRSVDPSTVPYEFSNVYQQDEFYPGSLVTLGEPYIMRDVRGIVVNAYPFAYNPVTQTLRVYHSMTIEINRVGADTRNVKVRHNASVSPYFKPIYEGQFINYASPRYDAVDEQGRLLVICDDNFMEAIQPYVDWKIQKGFDVDLVPMSEVGSDEDDVMYYVQAVYVDEGLTFVQLVGDAAQIPTYMYEVDPWTIGGSDPTYSLLEGNDNYPDIFVGRFSAETVAQVETQVERTIYYERDIVDGDWLHKGMGIASSQGAGQGDEGQSDYAHIGGLRTQLMAYTYSEIDEIYDNNGGTSSMVSSGLNAGRGEVMYCGHGSNTSWVSTGFSNSHVNALTNDYMLPFISSVACVNGNFTSTTCFAEAWLRATNGSTNAPTGAVAMYASTVNQDWAPPMESQDEYVNLLTGEEKNTVGGLWYNGSCSMMDNYTSGDGVDMFMTWHIFGDATLQVRTDTPEEFTITYPSELLIGVETYEVQTDIENAMVCLSYDGQAIGRGYTNASGNVTLELWNVPQQPCDLLLTVTGYNKITIEETVALLPNEGAYIVAGNLEYNDGNNSVPEFGEEITIDLPLNNVGSEAADNVVATITMDDPYVTITDDSAEIAQIANNSEVVLEDAFGIRIAGDIPDQHELTFDILISCTANGNDQQFESQKSVVVNAPAFELGNMDIFDVSGNNNGSLDPGETVALIVPITNTGHANALEGSAVLICNNPWITISENTVEINELDPEEDDEATFIVTLSANVDEDSAITFGFGYTSGSYLLQTTLAASVSMNSEDFENGIEDFGWSFTGNSNWTLDQEEAYEGDYCLTSGTISHNQYSTALIFVEVATDGVISFFRKVSSEADGDYLTFKIDGSQAGRWSGQVNWEMVSYPVTAGSHSFSWTYSKDGSLSNGYDRAWIDMIQFPSPAADPAPMIALSHQEIEFGEVLVNESASVNFTVYNYGSETLNGNIETYDGFLIAGTQSTRNSTNKKERTVREDYSFSISEQSYHTFTLIFAPENIDDYSGEIVITTNDPFMPETSITIDATGVGSGTGGDVPELVTELAGNFPNPFNPETNIAFSLAETSDVRIDVFNIKGQKVKTLVNEKLDKGNHSIIWGGEDNLDKQVSSGIYFYKMKAGRYTSTKKMILLK